MEFSVFPPKGGKERRLSGLLRPVAMLAALCLGSAGAWAQACPVTSTGDTNTSGTLRYCLNNLVSGASVGTNTITITATGKIRLQSSLPDIENGVTITGPGANQLDISGAGTYQVFTMGSSASPQVAISGLSISGGNASGSGGAIAQSGGSLTVSGCQFAANTSSANGGAIFASGILTVENSTFAGNSGLSGGAIDATGGLILTNSTFSGNSATGPNGGAVYAAGTTAITNNTFSGNSVQSGGSGGGVYFSSGTASIANNLFDGISNGGAIYNNTGTVGASYNVFYNDGGVDCHNCTTNTNSVDATADPLAPPLTYYGDTTMTLLPQPGSQAICKGSASAASTAGLILDQRGFAMDPASYTPCAAGSVDAGAVQTNYIQVQTGTDAGNGAIDCDNPTPSGCTLRDALLLANSNGYGDIDFASGVTSITLSGTGTLTLSGTTGINIIGPAPSTVTVNGGGPTSNFSVFTVDANVPALLYGLTISNGNTSTNGGGINNAGTLTVVDSTISANAAVNGGGIANSGTLSIAESTVAANSATSAGSSAYGGGIYNSVGSVNTINTTVAGNSASGNATDDGGGIYVAGGSATLANTIVSANTSANGADANIPAGYTDGGGNVIGGSTNATNNLVGGTGAPILPITGGGAPLLQLNGIGATVQTIIPLPGSPAICAGESTYIASGLSGDGLSTDERGYPLQPTGGYCTATEVDAGAVQTNYTSVNFVVQPSNVVLGTAMSPAPTLNVLETDTLLASSNTDAVNGIPITLTYSGTGTLSGNSATTTGGVAAFSGLTVSTTPGNGVTLGASVPVVGTTTLNATSSSFNVIGPATRLFVSAPLSTTVGVPISVTVTAYDVDGDIATGYAGTVHFTSTDPGTALVLPGNYTFVPATDQGVHIFANGVTLVTAPSQTVTATDTVTNTVTGFATVMVNKETPTVTMTPAGASINVDASVTFTATVSPAAGSIPVPFAGTMSFASNGTTITGCSTQPVNPSTGVATCTTTTLLAGSDAIAATYSGDSNYNVSLASAPTTQTVNKANTLIGLSPASQSANLNQPVTFTATVTAPGNGVMLMGQVVFTDNSTAIAACGGSTGVTVTWNSGPPSTGTAVCTTSSLSAGGHTILANYSNDSNYNNSGPAAATATISAVSGSVPLVLSPSGSSTVNQAVTITATVSYTSPTMLTGTMAFTDNGAAVPGCTISFNKTATANTGVATCTTQSLPLGSNTIVATYSGDPNYTPSPGTVTYTVNQTVTSLVLASVPASTAGVNQTVTFTATVTINQSGPTMPDGSVAFKDSVTSAAIPSCSAVALVSTASATTFTAGCATGTLALGGHTITATYSGDTNFAASSSTSLITISASSTSTALVSSHPAGSSVNQAVTFTATVTQTPAGVQPLTGLLTFTDNNSAIASCTPATPPATGVVTCTDAALTAGSHTIKATYSSDPNFAGSNSSLTQTVNQGTTTLALMSSAVANTSTINQSVTFTATVTPSPLGTNVLGVPGIVTFTDNGNPITAGSGVSCGTNGVVLITWNASTSTGTGACTTPALIVGSHTIKATYTLDPNFSGSINSITQTVTTATANLNLTPPSSTFSVNTLVPFLATFTPPSGAPTPTGTVTFTDTSATPAAVLCNMVIPTLPALPPGNTTYQAQCPISTLNTGTHVILAKYTGDTNFSIGSATTSITMNSATSSTTVTILSPATVVSSVLNQSGLEEAVKFQATVTPTSGPVLLSGTVAFTVNGTPIAGCSGASAVAVNPSTGIASCSATTANAGFVDSANVIGAIYTDQNYTNTTIPATQTVEDYSISVNFSNVTTILIPGSTPATYYPSLGFQVTQGYASGQTAGNAPIDPLLSSPLPAVAPNSIAGYATLTNKPASITCSSPTAGAPVCDLAASSLTIAAGTNADGITIDASGSGVKPGTYTFTVTATDPTTSIVRTTTFPVTVRPAATSIASSSNVNSGNVLTFVSGASGVTASVTFPVPAGVTLTLTSNTTPISSSSVCQAIAGTGITGALQPPSVAGVSCSVTPSPTKLTTSPYTATITITTTGTVTAAVRPPDFGNRHSALLVAALFGAPVFMLLGFRRSRKTFLSNLARMVAIAVVAMGALYSLGCGGSFTGGTTPGITGGTTPPGTYYLLIQGTGSDGNTYQSVLQVNVNF
jgi:predicted outer membrane repeat protein